MPYKYQIVGGGPNPKLTAIRSAVVVAVNMPFPDTFIAGQIALNSGENEQGEVLNISYVVNQTFANAAALLAYLNGAFKVLYPQLRSNFYLLNGIINYGNYERFEAASIVIYQRLLLELYPGAAVAWSVARKISGVYTGPLVRVRRSSDNAELDIGYNSNNDLNTVALQAFLNGANGFVVKIYDQSGNNNHVLQPLAASQPRLLLNQYGTRPSLVSDGVDDYMILTLQAAKSQPYTQAMVLNITGGAGEMFAMTMFSDTNPVGLIRVGGQTRVTTHGYTYSYIWPISTNQLLISNRNNTSGTGSLHRNGVNVGLGGAVANAFGIARITFFASSNATGTSISDNGAVRQPEYLLWCSEAGDISGSRVVIQNNINSYYNVF